MLWALGIERALYLARTPPHDTDRKTLAGRLFARGQDYGRKERYDESLADLTHSLELDPDNAIMLAYRGMIYGQLGRYDEALVDLDLPSNSIPIAPSR